MTMVIMIKLTLYSVCAPARPIDHVPWTIPMIKLALLCQYVSVPTGWLFHVIWSSHGSPWDFSRDFPWAFPRDLLQYFPWDLLCEISHGINLILEFPIWVFPWDQGDAMGNPLRSMGYIWHIFYMAYLLLNNSTNSPYSLFWCSIISPRYLRMYMYVLL